MVQSVGREAVDERQARDLPRSLQRHLQADGAAQGEADDVDTGRAKMIAKRPKRSGKSLDAATVQQRCAVAAPRQIGNDDAESLFEGRHLQRPIGAARAQPMNQHQRLTVAALEIVKRSSRVRKKSHFLSTLDHDTSCGRLASRTVHYMKRRKDEKVDRTTPTSGCRIAPISM